MSLMHRYEVTDRTGQRHVTTLADCLNVQRTPAWRQRVLDRSFHKVSAAGVQMQVEKSFFYLDLARGQAFLVHPPCERYRYRSHSTQLQRMLAVLPQAMRSRARQLRLVFGTEELREKLVAADAGLDDRAVELMKVAVLHDHPVLQTRPRLRMSLDRVDTQGAQFLCQYDHSGAAFEVSDPAADTDRYLPLGGQPSVRTTPLGSRSARLAITIPTPILSPTPYAAAPMMPPSPLMGTP